MKEKWEAAERETERISEETRQGGGGRGGGRGRGNKDGRSERGGS